jgi:alpha-1,2-mannosyltransferase
LFLLYCRYVHKKKAPVNSIGFFHPFANAGGGGEKVLFSAIRALATERPELKFFVYTGDTDDHLVIIAKTLDRFGINCEGMDIKFVRLRLRRLILPETYPVLTIVLQFLGSLVLTIEAWLRQPVTVFVDTHGHPAGYPFIRLFPRVPVVSYTHYPVISTDMI